MSLVLAIRRGRRRRHKFATVAAVFGGFAFVPEAAHKLLTFLCRHFHKPFDHRVLHLHVDLMARFVGGGERFPDFIGIFGFERVGYGAVGLAHFGFVVFERPFHQIEFGTVFALGHKAGALRGNRTARTRGKITDEAAVQRQRNPQSNQQFFVHIRKLRNYKGCPDRLRRFDNPRRLHTNRSKNRRLKTRRTATHSF